MERDAAKDWERLATWRMPFGRYKNRHLYDLPAEYLVWFEQHGWPKGELGDLLRIVLEAKREGAGEIFTRMRQQHP